MYTNSTPTNKNISPSGWLVLLKSLLGSIFFNLEFVKVKNWGVKKKSNLKIQNIFRLLKEITKHTTIPYNSEEKAKKF